MKGAEVDQNKSRKTLRKVRLGNVLVLSPVLLQTQGRRVGTTKGGAIRSKGGEEEASACDAKLELCN